MVKVVASVLVVLGAAVDCAECVGVEKDVERNPALRPADSRTSITKPSAAIPPHGQVVVPLQELEPRLTPPETVPDEFRLMTFPR